jgi:sarcosine oxidase subunit alpha
MSTPSSRLAEGGRIDRSRSLRFTFDGRAYEGFAGDTLASALLANGVKVVGRSFRLHRPRGVYSAGAEEPCAIVQIGRGAESQTDLKATQVLLTDGLEARSVNAWPSARYDLASTIGFFGALLPAGFYYKTFKWPRWNLFAPFIRRMGGLGSAPRERDPDVYAQTFAACDVLIIGAGPAGLSAALASGRSGARVILIDDKPELGGSLLESRQVIEGEPANGWVEAAARELSALPEVRVLTGTTATGWYDHNLITLVQDLNGGGPRQRLWKVRARRVVLAAGAFERPLVFPGNDRPGVMLASAARAYVNRFAVAPGRRAVIATNNDSGHEAALDLLEAGVAVTVVADTRPTPQGANINRLRERGVKVLSGHAPVSTKGRMGLRSVTLAPIDGDGRSSGQPIRVECDLLAVSGGWNPVVHLFSQSGGRVQYDEAAMHFAPGEWVQDGDAAGAATGEMSLAGSLRQGAGSGARAARLCGFEAVDAAASAFDAGPRRAPHAIWEVRGERGPAFVDLLNDVTAEDIRLAARENYASVEHLKRYTTLGMAVDQGKTSNVNGIGVLSEATGRPIPSIGTTKFRPPFNPVTLGVFAGPRVGEAFHALKRSPLHAGHLALGARMDEYGGWHRPAFYPLGPEDEEAAVRREALAVRHGAGLTDASPLGKILVGGPDVAVFLDRIYVNAMSSLKVGRCRYGLMLDDQGVVIDDGVAMRLSSDLFLVGTTSGHAAAIATWLEEWRQCEWPKLDVVIEPVTSQWATLTVAGPAARRVLEAFDSSLTLDDVTLPHMGFIEVDHGATALRIARVSFTGERSYEVSVAANKGESLWCALLDAGSPLGLAPVGVEALMRLRLEKGYLHVGADSETTSRPADIGYARLGASKPDDYLGRRGALRDPDRVRRQLVGVATTDVSRPIPLGAHVVTPADPARSQGWVTSSGFSPVLGRWVALAVVEGGIGRIGETVALMDGGAGIEARLTEVCAYDPEGQRLNA